MELDQLLFNARRLLKERTDSLQKDVRYCILRNEGTPDWPAPFPAILYCFSTIDLLAALYGGDAGEGAKSTKQSKNYMIQIMSYPEKGADLIQRVFRHKLVPLVQPNPVIRYNNKLYTWYYEHNNRSIHLEEVPTDKSNIVRFCISIWSLVEDIVDSVYKPNGYLHRLENEGELQKKFKKAYNQIFEQYPLMKRGV